MILEIMVTATLPGGSLKFTCCVLFLCFVFVFNTLQVHNKLSSGFQTQTNMIYKSKIFKIPTFGFFFNQKTYCGISCTTHTILLNLRIQLFVVQPKFEQKKICIWNPRYQRRYCYVTRTWCHVSQFHFGFNCTVLNRYMKHSEWDIVRKKVKERKIFSD